MVEQGEATTLDRLADGAVLQYAARDDPAADETTGGADEVGTIVEEMVGAADSGVLAAIDPLGRIMAGDSELVT